MLTHAFVTLRLDYCNSRLHGISKSLITRLQHVFNSAARIVSKTKMCNHITPVLKSLHWLPVLQRCAFKTALLNLRLFMVKLHHIYLSLLNIVAHLEISGLLMIYYLMFLGLNFPLVHKLLLFLHLHFGIVCPMIFIVVLLCSALNPNSKPTCSLLLLVSFILCFNII